MKIEKSGCCEPEKLSWSQCEVGQVYLWPNSGEYYLKASNNAGILLRSGNYSGSIVGDPGWVHVPHAKLVV